MLQRPLLVVFLDNSTYCGTNAIKNLSLHSSGVFDSKTLLPRARTPKEAVRIQVDILLLRVRRRRWRGRGRRRTSSTQWSLHPPPSPFLPQPRPAPPRQRTPLPPPRHPRPHGLPWRTMPPGLKSRSFRSASPVTAQ